MFSLSSCSPAEIHILLPNRRYVPLSCGSARVVTSDSDEPACGSDRHIVPKKRPSTIGRTYASTISGVPYFCSRLALPMVKKGYDEVPTLAAWNHAKQAPATTLGSCIPPIDSSIALAISPLCAKTSRACLISGIRWTRSPSNVGSCASLFLLCGRKCLVAI